MQNRADKTMIRKKHRISYNQFQIKEEDNKENRTTCSLCSDLQEQIKSLQKAQARTKQDTSKLIAILKRLEAILMN
jgi:hypothetical protein